MLLRLDRRIGTHEHSYDDVTVPKASPFDRASVGGEPVESGHGRDQGNARRGAPYYGTPLSAYLDGRRPGQRGFLVPFRFLVRFSTVTVAKRDENAIATRKACPLPGRLPITTCRLQLPTEKKTLANLFAADACFHAPDGLMYRGLDEIAAFYRRYLANVVPTFHIHRAVANGNDCWMKLANGPVDNPVLLASNHFTVDDDGLITRLAVYLRPRPPR